MPKRSSKEPSDRVQNAFRVIQESLESEPALTVLGNPALLSQVMAAIGRKGGKIGGKRRLVTMTAERRQEIARQAAEKRWKKAKKSRKT